MLVGVVDFGSVRTDDVPGSIGGSVDGEPGVVFESVVFAAQRRPVPGVGSSLFGVLNQVIGLTGAGRHAATGPDAMVSFEFHGVTGRSGEEAGFA